MCAWEINIFCDEVGIITNTKKILHESPWTPHEYILISHTFSTHFYWLCLRPHIKTHQSSQYRLMKASAETAAFHMWFKLMSHPESLTLAGHAAFLIFTVLFSFTLEARHSLPKAQKNTVRLVALHFWSVQTHFFFIAHNMKSHLCLISCKHIKQSHSTFKQHKQTRICPHSNISFQ